MIRILCLSGLLLSVFACGQEQVGPAIPQPIATRSPSADADKPLAPDPNSPTATGDIRLSALPDFLQEQVIECQTTQHFYDLGSQTCTDTLLANFPCALDQALRDLLDPTTLAPLDTYLATKAVHMILYSCTTDATNISLHFYNFIDGVVQYRKLNVAKKP